MKLSKTRKEYTFHHIVTIPDGMDDQKTIDDFVDMDIFSQPLPDLDGEIDEIQINRGQFIVNGKRDVTITIYTSA